MKCKPYSEITVEIGTQLKTVKITSNIFEVWAISANKMIISHCVRNSFFHKLYCILYMYQSNVQFTAQNAFSCAHRLHNIMK